MQLLGWSVIIIMTLIAIFHFYWAFGGTLGMDKALPTTPEGTRLLNPSKGLTFMVGIMAAVFAFVACQLSCYDDPAQWYRYISWVVSALFLLRSIGDFSMVGFFRKITTTPFATYDRLFYVPLCLYLACAYAFLAYNV